MVDQWALDRKMTDATLASLRADPLWTEIFTPNGLIEFRGQRTGDVYRVTTWGCMRYVRNDAR